MPNLKEQLEDNLANVDWQSLLPHAKRDALIVVDEQLDLLDVAVAMAEDNAVVVSKWIENKLIFKPSSSQLTSWNAKPSKQFATAIVQPFVIVQEVTTSG